VAKNFAPAPRPTGGEEKRDAEGDADEERLECTQPVRVLQPAVAGGA
jgi:hypothetical protein